MPTYDVHRHVWPDRLVEALAARTRPPRLHGGVLELAPGGAWEVDAAAYTLEACLQGLDRDGIDRAVVSVPPTFGIELLPGEEAEPLLDAYHEGALELVAASGGRLLAWSLGRVLDGFAGACVAAGTLAELDRLAPLLDELERRGRVLFVHPGPVDEPEDGLGWWVAVVDYPAQMQAAYAAWLAHGVDRWPDLRVVFAILAGGAPFQLERLQSRGADIRGALRPTLYLETASYGRRALELCLATYGAQQIVYGSDAPVIDGRPTLESIRSLGQAAADALCGHNPTALLA